MANDKHCEHCGGLMLLHLWADGRTSWTHAIRQEAEACQEKRIHEMKMAACNLRPKPFISTRGGRYFYGNSRSCYSSETLVEAIKTAIWDRTKVIQPEPN